MSDYVDLDALWKVLLASLPAGAGLAAVFSLALVGLSGGRTAGRAGAGRRVTRAGRAGGPVRRVAGPVRAPPSAVRTTPR
ncbi:hypothetical protein ACIBCT_23220 [Streptosporangium sp. NPDC050855]|uniref:hypothetical protein n=1 Tax=Streptosporangium sp. NPDC050855 TaxID=3366194 RepID=UPI0037BC7832